LRTSFNPIENQEFKGERDSSVWRATMADVKWLPWLERGDLEHAARTAVAAGAPLLIARLLRMPEAYWAAIISLTVTQSALGATWTISKDRLVGCAVGATMGGLLATYLGPNTVVFSIGVFVMGMICAMLRIPRIELWRRLASIIFVETKADTWLPGALLLPRPGQEHCATGNVVGKNPPIEGQI
jgi:uncharacterized membrane protein YccC